MNNQFKVGDLVTYKRKRSGDQRYAVISEITEPYNCRLWGKWCDSVEEALNPKPFTETLYVDTRKNTVTLVCNPNEDELWE